MNIHTPVQDLARSRVPPGFRGRSAVFVQFWWICQTLLIHASPQAFYGWRRAILRLFGAKIGFGVLIRPSVVITYPWKVAIGDHSWIGDNAELYSLGPITIEDNVVVSQGSYLCAATHDFEDDTFPLVAGPIVVEREAWIAAQCFIAPGVTIGAGSVAGARSVVLEDVPPGVIVAGHPAKIIGTREKKQKQK